MALSVAELLCSSLCLDGAWHWPCCWFLSVAMVADLLCSVLCLDEALGLTMFRFVCLSVARFVMFCILVMQRKKGSCCGSSSSTRFALPPFKTSSRASRSEQAVMSTGKLFLPKLPFKWTIRIPLSVSPSSFVSSLISKTFLGIKLGRSHKRKLTNDLSLIHTSLMCFYHSSLNPF